MSSNDSFENSYVQTIRLENLYVCVRARPTGFGIKYPSSVDMPLN